MNMPFISRLALAALFILLMNGASADALDDGLSAFNVGDYGRAMQLWQPLADDGDPKAQYNVALLYYKGLGVEQDYRTALVWYNQAARAGHVQAMFNMGMMYLNGEGVFRSNQDAFYWISEAAKRGLAAAQYNAGVMNAYAIGCGRDEIAAVRWWRLAAEQSYPDAIRALATGYREGRFGLPKDAAQAAALERQLPTAQ